MTTVSVSKGVFIFKNGIKAASKKSRQRTKITESLFSDSFWYKTYKSLWDMIEAKIQDLNNEMFSNVLSNLVNYIKDCYNSPMREIPAAALLTGINMPDHSAQFTTLRKELKQFITPHVAILRSEDCQNLKYMVENIINQLVKEENGILDEDDSDSGKRIKKSQCNFAFLQSWYEDSYVSASKKKVIVIIIPDFESFAPKILQDFILIASSYINILPFVLVFGVATSLSAVHRSLPYHVSAQVNIQIFNSSPSTVYLNNVIENILFSRDCPFHLGGKVFNLFTDIFLFYDLSVSGFIQNFKYAMLEHFSYGNATALCKRKDIKSTISQFTHEDLENVRRLLSFRKLVESDTPENRIRLITDDDYFRNVLRKEIKKISKYITNLHLYLKCLWVLVCDLPKAPLGKQVRELYSFAVSKNITKSQEYKECFQLLSFHSKEELCGKITQVMNLLVNNIETSKWEQSEIINTVEKISNCVNSIKNLDFEEIEEMEATNTGMEQMDRKLLKQKLLSMSKHHKPLSKYEKIRSEILQVLSSQFEKHLLEPNTFPFFEIFFFNDISIQNHIIGSHRAAIHTALNDPQYYLQCDCCEIASDSIISQSMPDISIIYKLHLECGKMINLYDWLQSFLSIVDPEEVDDNSKPSVKPQLQARFTQAVSELEYLGFIKSSKRKTDHVARLTWGG